MRCYHTFHLLHVFFQFLSFKSSSSQMILAVVQTARMGPVTQGLYPSYQFESCSQRVQFFSDECSTRGGTSSGSCANGYGVCCTCKGMDKYFGSASTKEIPCFSHYKVRSFEIRKLYLLRVCRFRGRFLRNQHLSLLLQHLPGDARTFLDSLSTSLIFAQVPRTPN